MIPENQANFTMQLVIPRETQPGENRVSATPETVKKLVRLGAEVVIESGAGTGAGISDACLLYTSPSPRDATLSRMPSSA